MHVPPSESTVLEVKVHKQKYCSDRRDAVCNMFLINKVPAGSARDVNIFLMVVVQLLHLSMYHYVMLFITAVPRSKRTEQ